MTKAENEILNLINKRAGEARMNAHTVLHNPNASGIEDAMRFQLSSMDLIRDLIEILQRPEKKD